MYRTPVPLMLALLCPSIILMVDAKQSNGKWATKLDEYHGTIKCVLNIAEETLPKLDHYVACCGYWSLHDWFLAKVNSECDNDTMEQVSHLSGLIDPHIRDQCIAYQQGSFTCRMLLIMPITIVILSIILLLSFCICAHVSLWKWIAIRKKYRKVINLQLGDMGDHHKEPFILNKKGSLSPSIPQSQSKASKSKNNHA